ncbi:MAG: HemK2/MTQ2 family protein methyltransferase [Nanobdellota archaeon]
MIYEPREDSDLLARNVNAYASGKVLDMGSGTGIQAKSAERAKEVLCADLDPEAVERCRKEGLKSVESDLFSEIKEKFDTIIFNPPYLPEDPYMKDKALDGGKEGWELSERFLREAREHLEDKGIILFLFSSLTGREKIDSILKENGYDHEQLDSMKLDFEELYVYKIWNT